MGYYGAIRDNVFKEFFITLGNIYIICLENCIYTLSQLCKKYTKKMPRRKHQLTVIVFEWLGYESFIFFFILF